MKSRASKTWKLRATPWTAAEEVRARRLWKSSARSLLGEVDHLALVSDADHALETRRAPEHVVRKPLASGVVVGAQPDGMMDPEARVRPAEHLRDERRTDLAALQQQIEDLFLPELLEGLVVEWGNRNERAVGCERAVGHERMEVRMPMDQLAEGVDGPDHARRRVPAVQDGAVDLQHRLPGEARQFTEKSAVEAEEDPQPPGDREHKLPVGDPPSFSPEAPRISAVRQVREWGHKALPAGTWFRCRWASRRVR